MAKKWRQCLFTEKHVKDGKPITGWLQGAAKNGNQNGLIVMEYEDKLLIQMQNTEEDRSTTSQFYAQYLPILL
jgi:hypothetical protein